MPGKDDALTVDPCDICGDVGFAELILSCSKCRVFREHRYCSRVVLTEDPEVWLCESCQSKNVTRSPCKVNQNCSLQASKRQQTVRTGKVKFLHEDEVIKLSSGSFPSQPVPSSSTFSMTKKAFVGSKNVSQKIPSQKSNPCISPMGHGKLSRNEVQKNQTIDHTSHSLPKGQPKENRLASERRMCEKIFDRKVQTLDLCAEKLAKGASRKAVLARKSIPISGSGAIAECDRSDIKKCNIHSIEESFYHYRKYLPSSICAWRGQFRFLQAEASGEYYNEFEAQPPCVVNRKAYEQSTKMQSVLQLESLPALNVLTDIFRDDPPSLQDIALYFFPTDNEGSRKNLSSIFKFMNAEKSMLRCFIDGVELLVFTSRDLNMDSRDTIAALNEGNFLWGVFRKNKVDDIKRLPDLESVDMDIDMIGGKDLMGRIDHVPKDKLKSLTPENKVADDIERLQDLEDSDMDIDMIGGKDLMGRIDHVLKDKPRSLTQSSLKETPVLKTTSKNVEENTSLTTSNLNLYGQDKSVLSERPKKKTKSEPSFEPFSLKYAVSNVSNKVDAPPGFVAHGSGKLKQPKV